MERGKFPSGHAARRRNASRPAVPGDRLPRERHVPDPVSGDGRGFARRGSGRAGPHYTRPHNDALDPLPDAGLDANPARPVPLRAHPPAHRPHQGTHGRHVYHKRRQCFPHAGRENPHAVPANGQQLPHHADLRRGARLHERRGGAGRADERQRLGAGEAAQSHRARPERRDTSHAEALLCAQGVASPVGRQGRARQRPARALLIRPAPDALFSFPACGVKGRRRETLFSPLFPRGYAATGKKRKGNAEKAAALFGKSAA